MTGPELVKQSLSALDDMVKDFAPQTSEDGIAIATSMLTKAAQLLTAARDRPFAATIFYLHADGLVTEELDQ